MLEWNRNAFLCHVLVFVLVSTCYGDSSYYISPEGANTQLCSATEPCGSISAVLVVFGNSTDDLTIHISPGTYSSSGNSQIVFPNVPVKLLGANSNFHCANLDQTCFSVTNNVTINSLSISTCGTAVKIDQASYESFSNFSHVSFLHGSTGAMIRSEVFYNHPDFTNCTFSNLTTGIDAQNAKMNLEQLSFQDVSLSFNLDNCDSVTLESSTFLSSGGFVAKGSSGRIANSNFLNTYDAAVSLLGGTWTIEHTKFENGHQIHHYWGGAGGVMVITSSAIVKISSCVFRNNSALNGGSLYVYSARSVYIIGTLFEKNSAVYSGGAIFVNDVHLFSVVNSTFNENSCSEEDSIGGAVVFFSIQYAVKKFIFEEVLFSNNEAHNGAAIGCCDSSEDCSITILYDPSTIKFVNNTNTIGEGGEDCTCSVEFPPVSLYMTPDGIDTTSCSILAPCGSFEDVLNVFQGLTGQKVALSIVLQSGTYSASSKNSNIHFPDIPVFLELLGTRQHSNAQAQVTRLSL